jgi:hypothetical protein
VRRTYVATVLPPAPYSNASICRRSRGPRPRPFFRKCVRSSKTSSAARRRTAGDPVAKEINALLLEIAHLGVDVKDPDQGLIDFPAKRRGREILLCWKLGEGDRISYWHDLETGFAGRKLIED